MCVSNKIEYFRINSANIISLSTHQSQAETQQYIRDTQWIRNKRNKFLHSAFRKF